MPELLDDSQAGSSGRRYSKLRRGLAWCVHLLTASGVICCLLALEATRQSRWQTALLWLVLAVIIDAVDGTFARLVDVKAVLPNFDGTLLDNLVDFANYVIVPALIIHRAHLVPDAASLCIASLICLASSYQFCQNDAKTSDHFFRGFPSYWNVAALYLLALDLSPRQNLAIVVALVVMVFVPIKYIYVTRTRAYRAITFALTAIWAVMAMVILWQLPEPQPLLVWSSMLYLLYYFCISLSLTLRKQPQPS